MSLDVVQAFKAASKALIARTDALADVGTPLPARGDGRAPFKYTRDLLDWVLQNQETLADADLAGRCFDALCLLGIAHAVPETDVWMRAKQEWTRELNETQEIMQREII